MQTHARIYMSSIFYCIVCWVEKGQFISHMKRAERRRHIVWKKWNSNLELFIKTHHDRRSWNVFLIFNLIGFWSLTLLTCIASIDWAFSKINMGERHTVVCLVAEKGGLSYRQQQQQIEISQNKIKAKFENINEHSLTVCTHTYLHSNILRVAVDVIHCI